MGRTNWSICFGAERGMIGGVEEEGGPEHRWDWIITVAGSKTHPHSVFHKEIVLCEDLDLE